MDNLVRWWMKSAAKCDKRCELQNFVNHQNLERKWHSLLKGSKFKWEEIKKKKKNSIFSLFFDYGASKQNFCYLTCFEKNENLYCLKLYALICSICFSSGLLREEEKKGGKRQKHIHIYRLITNYDIFYIGSFILLLIPFFTVSKNNSHENKKHSRHVNTYYIVSVYKTNYIVFTRPKNNLSLILNYITGWI